MPKTRYCLQCGRPLAPEAAGDHCAGCLAALAFGPEGTRVSAAAAETPPAASGRDPRTRSPSIHYFGDYELIEEIARGGMGVVWKARQVSLNRVVAVKLLLSGQFSRPEFVRRFRTEAEAAANLQHPHIVAIHEVGEHDGEHYFSMDYIAGGDLAQHSRTGPLPAKQAAAWMKTIAEAVHHAHQRGVLHRDLKPSNILLDAAGQPHITDFGLAKLLNADRELTVPGQVMGTPGFMPPEQADPGRGPVTAASDVYSLGAILYHLLTGRPPFAGESPVETLHQVVHSELVSPRLLNSKMPRDLETLCLKCLEKEPRRRFASAAELADELRLFLADEPIRARPVSAPEKLWRWAKRKPVLAALSATVLALLLALAVGSRMALHSINEKSRGVIQAEQSTRRHLYAAQISLARRAWLDGDAGRMLDLLDAAGPRPGQEDGRGFEWHYLLQLARRESASWRRAGGNPFAAPLALCPSANRMAAVGSVVWPPSNPDGAGSGQPPGLASNVYAVILHELSSGRVRGVVWIPGTPPETERGGSTSKEWNWMPGRGDETAERFGVVPPAGLALSPDGRWLALAAPNGRGPGSLVAVWSVSDIEALNQPAPRLLPQPESARRERGLPPGHDVEISERAILLRPRRVFTLFGHDVVAVAFSPDGDRLAARLATLPKRLSGSVRVWSLPSGAMLRSIDNVACSSPLLEFSPNGRLLAAPDNLSALTMWETTGWNPQTNGDVWNSSLAGCFAPDSSAIAQVEEGSSFRQHVGIWNLPSGTLQCSIPHEQGCRAVAFSTDGRFLATGDGTAVRVWDAKTGNALGAFVGHRWNVTRLAFLPEGASPSPIQSTNASPVSSYLRGYEYLTRLDGRLTSVDAAGVVKIWEMAELREASSSPHSTLALQGGTAAVDVGNGFALLGADGRLGHLYSRSTNALTTAGVVWSADERNVIVAEWIYETPSNAWFTVRNAGAAVELGRWRGLGGTPAGGLALSPDGQLLAAAPAGLDRVIVWNLKTQTEWARLELPSDQFAIACSWLSLVFSPDGARLALSGNTGTVVWDVHARAVVAELDAPAAVLAFAPDSHRLVAAATRDSRAGRLDVWDTLTRERLLDLGQHTVPFSAAAFSPDGKTLAAATADGKIRLWNLASGIELFALSVPSDAIEHLSFTPDGRTLMAANIREILRWSGR